MSDNWLNIGHEDDWLLPYKQPEVAVQNPVIGKLNYTSFLSFLPVLVVLMEK